MTTRILLLGFAAALPLVGMSQEYPTRPIRLVIPQAPGGAADTFARIIAQRISPSLGQPVLIDNRPGASGIIGSDHVAKSAPDGYTILVAFGSHHLLPFVAKKLPFDAVRDFTPIIIAARTPFCLVVNASVPATNALELIEYVRRNPGRISYASPGAGSASHLAGELMNLSAKIDLMHVAYKGGAPAIADLVSGQIPVGIFVLSTVAPHVRSGKLRALGVVEGRRARSGPDIPTLAEAGIPGFPIPDSWLGMLGPAALPDAIIRRLNAEIGAAIAAPEVRERIEGVGLEVMGNTPEEFRETVTRNSEIYRKIVSEAGIKADQ